MEASGQLRRGARIAALAALLVAGLPAAPAAALGLRVVGRFQQPVYVTAPPGQSARLFVIERGGRIMVVRRGRKFIPLVSFGEDARGHLYAVSMGGPVYRLVP